MDKKQFEQALALCRQHSPKRKFAQSVELIINLKELDLKKQENQLDLYVQLPGGIGRKVKVGCLIGPEMLEQAKTACDTYILQDQFVAWAADKKKQKKLAREMDYFIAQATIMPLVAKTFGKVFGPRGKMPNPKAGCVVPPNANLKPLVEKLSKTVRITAKTQLSIKKMIGKENEPDAGIVANASTIYDQVLHHLPQEANNIKNVMLKFTMGPPVIVGEHPVVKLPKAGNPSGQPAEANKPTSADKKASKQSVSQKASAPVNPPVSGKTAE
ncbi:50S ribosomal protein L1 [Candidatus Woesearchaeota archaeon]|nr:50S ribosomal protein L1 [Candidatus Woesearchaeota archaeon]